MQADYALCRDIMRACHEALPNALPLADLREKLPDTTDDNIRYHIEVLEREGFVETRQLRSSAGGPGVEPVRYVRLSHPLAAARFLDRPEGPPN